MAAVLHYGVFVLLLVVGIEGAKITRMTADELFSSALWKDASKTLLILGEGKMEPPAAVLVARDIHNPYSIRMVMYCCQWKS